MEVDNGPFHDWWTKCLGRPPILKGWVIPILRNLQGHPEAPRLWHKHIDSILIEHLGFDHCTHEPCLYFKPTADHGLIIVLRQVDDFLIGAKTEAVARTIRDQIQTKMTNNLNNLGIIKLVNGMDVLQTRDYVKINYSIYCWHNEPNTELPKVDLPSTITKHEKLKPYFQCHDPLNLEGASNSTWATDRRHRRSTGGIVFFFEGGAVFYRARIHPTIAQSSTEAEFAFMTDAGKPALYLGSILEELNLEQLHPTGILVDNKGARQLTNTQQPTRAHATLICVTFAYCNGPRKNRSSSLTYHPLIMSVTH
jgi:hypothetical protein